MLREQGVNALARRTKVSVARFERLLSMLRDPTPTDAMLTVCSRTVLLAHLWANATSKRCLAEFLDAASHAVGDALWADRAAFDADFGPEDASEPPADSAAATLSPAALERLAFSLCRRGALPDVVQERHGWRGQPDVPDCVEACAREVLTHAIFDPGRHRLDASRLPPTTDAAVAAFFAADGECHRPRAGAAWFALCCARDGLNYVREDYELYPSIESFCVALGSLVGRELHPPPQSDLAPLWDGCAIGWRASPFSGAMKRPVLVFGAVDPSEAARMGELRVVFNDGVHCYSLKQTGAAEEAPWVDGWRRAWLELWRRGELPPEQHVASTLLLPSQLLQAVSHGLARGSLPGGDASAVLAVLAATPPHGRAWGTHERLQALRALVAGVQHERERRLRVLLPLVLDREGDAHSDLSLDSAAELLHAAITAEPALRGAALEACEGQPALVALIALRGGLHDELHAAVARCDGRERAQLLRVGVGFTGYRLGLRLRLLGAVASAAARGGTKGEPWRLALSKE